jgi:hypothetical protein
MITANLFKDGERQKFSLVKLDLYPNKIVFVFKEKSFSILFNELLEYNISTNKIIFKIKTGRINRPLVVSVQPIQKNKLGTIIQHLENNFGIKKESKEVINPMYN